MWWLGCATMVARTRYRIEDWKDDWSLFHAALQTCPNSAKTNNQVGQLWMNKQNPTMALSYYKKAAEIDPEFCDADYTQALAYAALGDIGKAKILLKKSLYCVFTSNGAFSNLQLIWKHEL
jgi:tetratricopeptide (TPR) repeat protein